MTLEERNAKLAEAKALVLKGWMQGEFTDGLGSFCMNGAVKEVLGEEIYFTKNEVNTALYGALVTLRLGTSVTKYNDAPGRTKYEVAAIFDHAMEEPLG